MTVDSSPTRADRPIALLLSVGTGIATLLVVAGMSAGLILPPSSSVGYTLSLIGVGIFVIMPVARVLLMLILFVRQRDFVLAATALAVLLIIALGSAVAAIVDH